MERSKKTPQEAAMDRLRFALAIALSALVLLGAPVLIKRFYPSAPPPPPPPAQPSESATQQQGTKPAKPAETTPAKSPAAVSTTQATPRDITITTSLWKVKLSNRGAVATSWILVNQKHPDGKLTRILAADNSDLELVSTRGLEIAGAPLRIRTPWSPDLGVNLNQSYFEIQGAGGDSEIRINDGESRTITFNYASGDVTARKSFTFYGDRSIFNASVEVRRGAESPPVEIVFGPHFGDQSDTQKGSYSTPPQVVGCTPEDHVDRIPGAKITGDFGKVKAVDHSNNVIEVDAPLARDVDA
ncbi:MAG TPA: membrane protein insertase YidC, partial [Blastocatellia bacterium]|nr:membrane protein insertase YidC [Blastocatellia bacterium]